jgi:hypothetical protein
MARGALRRAVRPTIVALATGSALLATAGSAAAAVSPAAAVPPAELVSRATGANGWSPLKFSWFNRAGAISSNGRYSAFSVGLLAFAGEDGESDFRAPLYVRDIQANTTVELAPLGFSSATAFDRGDRLLSFSTDQPLVPEDTDTLSDLYLYDAITGQKALIGRASGVNGAPAKSAQGIVSGDGRSVVFQSDDLPGLGAGVFRRDLTTNITSKISGALASEQGEIINSISDDGRKVGTFKPSTGAGSQGTLITAAERLSTTGSVRISADGSTAAWIRPQAADGRLAELVFRRLATGTETLAPLPPAPFGANDPFSGSSFPDILWIAPDASQVATTQEYLLWEPSIYPPTLYTRSTGKFEELTGPFEHGLRGSSNGSSTAISRTGQFGLISGSLPFKGLYAVNLWGKALPGGTDPAPASEYIALPSGITCDFDHPGKYAYVVYPGLAPEYVEAAKSITTSLTVDGKQLGSATTTAGVAQPKFLYLTNLSLGTAKSLTLRATVTTLSGKKIVGDWTEKPQLPLC